MSLSCTIYYKGKLKKKYNPMDLFNKIIENINDTKWNYEIRNENNLTITINAKSEPLNFYFENSCINNFCKVNVENNEEFVRVLDLFFDVHNMFFKFELQDDYGAWNDYLANKNPCKIKFRELTSEEMKRVKKFDKISNTSKNILLRIIGESIKKNKNDEISYQYLIDNINPNITGYCFASMEGLELFAILETWVFETMTYKNFGRVSEIDKNTRGLISCINAFTFGISETLFGLCGGSTGDKQAQIRKFYIQKIANKHLDIQKDSILMYQYIVSILDYLGFKIVEKK